MWITHCFLTEIVVLRADSSITQYAFHYWCQFWYSPSGTIENSAPLCFRTIGSLQKKDTKWEHAKLIPFQLQLEQKTFRNDHPLILRWTESIFGFVWCGFFGLALFVPWFLQGWCITFLLFRKAISCVWWGPGAVWGLGASSTLGRAIVCYDTDPLCPVSSSGCGVKV